MEFHGRLTGHDRSNIRLSKGRIFDRSSGTFDLLKNLTGHVAYRLFDRLSIKYPVPIKNRLSNSRLTSSRISG